MKKIDRVLKQLGDLYEFNRRIREFTFKAGNVSDKPADGEIGEGTVPHTDAQKPVPSVPQSR